MTPAPRLLATPGQRLAIRHAPNGRAYVVRKGWDSNERITDVVPYDVAIRELSRRRLHEARVRGEGHTASPIPPVPAARVFCSALTFAR